MSQVVVYGFGSFFSAQPESSDIDLLLIHDDVSAESCTLVVRCKQYLMRTLNRVHVTILSIDEEREFGFIAQARARPIGLIDRKCINAEIDRISRSLANTQRA